MAYPLVVWNPTNGDPAAVIQGALDGAGVQLFPGVHLITHAEHQGWDAAQDFVYALVQGNQGMQAMVILAEPATTQVIEWVDNEPNLTDDQRHYMNEGNGTTYPIINTTQEDE